MSLREQILSAAEPGLALHEVPVPEWGTVIYLRGWTGKERERFERDFGDLERAGDNIRARVLVRCLRDETGALIFGETDADALGDKSAGVLAVLFAKVMDLSGLRQADQETARKN